MLLSPSPLLLTSPGEGGPPNLGLLLLLGGGGGLPPGRGGGGLLPNPEGGGLNPPGGPWGRPGLFVEGGGSGGPAAPLLSLFPLSWCSLGPLDIPGGRMATDGP